MKREDFLNVFINRSHEVETVILYDEFVIYKIDGTYYYFDRNPQSKKDPVEVELAAVMRYSILNDLLTTDQAVLDSMFDFDYSGECVEDRYIMYMWFKRKDDKND